MKKDCHQRSLFDEISEDNFISVKNGLPFNNLLVSRFKSYTLEKYISDVENYGLAHTWTSICEYVLTHGNNPNFLNTQNFGELYEIGLAIQDKFQKKNNGQYYTPTDVATIMCEWYDAMDGVNICDVACGTGKLILTYLDTIGFDRAEEIIREGRLYLYDIDETALTICKTAILMKYGQSLGNNIHCIVGDFLSSKIALPDDCKVISNPPYAKIQRIEKDWKYTKVLYDSVELYSCRKNVL